MAARHLLVCRADSRQMDAQHEHGAPSSNLPLQRRYLDEPSEQEAKAAAMAVARTVDSAVQMLRPGTRITCRRPPPALLAVRFGAHDILIVRGVGSGGNGLATWKRGTFVPTAPSLTTTRPGSERNKHGQSLRPQQDMLGPHGREGWVVRPGCWLVRADSAHHRSHRCTVRTGASCLSDIGAEEGAPQRPRG